MGCVVNGPTEAKNADIGIAGGKNEALLFKKGQIIAAAMDGKLLSAKELIDSEQDCTYGKESVLPNKSCSFRYSYISSYLFVRGCIETIEKKHQLTKAEAIQQFLEIVKHSNCRNEWLVFDIANAIGISKEKLLIDKEMQINIINSI